MAEEDKGKASPSVKNASPTRSYSFLPASCVGNTHEETDFLPIGNREEKEGQSLNRHTDSLEMMRVLYDKVLADEDFQDKGTGLLAKDNED